MQIFVLHPCYLFFSLGILLFVLATTAPATTVMARLFFFLVIILIGALLSLALALILALGVLVDLHDHRQNDWVPLGLVKEEPV